MTCSKVGPGSRFSLSNWNETRLPTIFSANSLSFVSDVVNVSMTRPRRMTVTRSDTSMISFSLCVIRMMDLPSAAKLRRICISS